MSIKVVDQPICILKISNYDLKLYLSHALIRVALKGASVLIDYVF
jgi:hypothetical protein